MNSSNQTILIHGEDIGYQFARSGWGHRTYRRTVREVKTLDGRTFGKVTIKGREIIVTECYGLWRVANKNAIDYT